MNIDPILLYHYTIWANERLMEGVRQLSEEQLHTPIREGFFSPLGLLVHMMAAEQVWLSRWNGVSPRALLSEAEIPTLQALETAWAEQRQNMLAYLAEVGEADQVIHYQTTKGDEVQNVLWHMILHVINHSTEHRAQLALHLAMLGIDVGGLDFSKYMRGA